ncbi:MAG: hypothetical protein LBK99_12570, partial [Opitutaceae bacterium]|nr:hypothetical protein [Opitutaceae bacterium]
MKTVWHTTTLFYYDGPQVFEARDAIGGHYIGLMIEPVGSADRYLVAGIEPERLRLFRSGLLDLRDLLVERNLEEWYLAESTNGLSEALALHPQSEPIAQSAFLPDPGFVLHDRPAEELALREARMSNNVVLEVAVEPPEAVDGHRIRAGTLAGLLGHVQTIVKHAYGAALRDLPLSNRRAIDRSEAHLLDVVVPAAPGSFRIIFEGAKAPDLLGQSELVRALDRVDVLFEKASDPIQALATVKQHRGHLARSYLNLLRFLAQHRMGLRYAWAEPTFDRPRGRAVTESEVGPLITALSSVSNLGSESVELVGTLEKADVGRGNWRLSTSDGAYSGSIKPDGPGLAGLIPHSVPYRFSCVEEIDEAEGTGREQRTLYLIEH